MITFAHPALLWLLLALPADRLSALAQGPRAAVRYASVATARAVARTSRARLGQLLAVPAAARGGPADRRAGQTAGHPLEAARSKRAAST